MPLYAYKYLDGEQERFEEYQHIHEDALTEHEGRPCERTVQSFQPHTRYGKGTGSNPIEMLSIAVDSEEEVDAFRERNPGVEISRDRSSRVFGVPIATSRSEKLRILQREGFAETN